MAPSLNANISITNYIVAIKGFCVIQLMMEMQLEMLESQIVTIKEKAN